MQYAVIDARLKTLDEQENLIDRYRIVCGRQSKPCPGMLGLIRHGTDDPDRQEMAFDLHHTAGPGEEPPSRWIASHEHGFRWDAEQQAYRVLRPETRADGRPARRKRGRRQTPPDVQASGRVRQMTGERREQVLAQQERVAKRGRANRDIIGQFPVLPAVIICPVCGRPNHIPVPE